MKSDNKPHSTYSQNRQPNDPYRDRNPNHQYEGSVNGPRVNDPNSPNYRNDMSRVEPNYRDAYNREALHNRHLARENDSLRYRQSVERDRIASRYQADTGRNFLLGVLIIGLAALGFGIFYYVGRSETVDQPTLPNPVEVPVPEQPEAETPDINIDLPDNPPEVQLPEINVPDVDVQVPEATGGAENPVPAENPATDSGTAPAEEAVPPATNEAGSETPQ